jgi:hypothetical protein
MANITLSPPWEGLLRSLDVCCHMDTFDSSRIDYGQTCRKKSQAVKLQHNPRYKNMIKDKVDIVESLDTKGLNELIRLIRGLNHSG